MFKQFSAICAFTGMIAVFPQALHANPISAVVTKVVDGDTVMLNQGGTSKTAQLACIDSPDWINGKPEPNAQNSKNRLAQLLPVGSSVQYYAVGNAGGRNLAVIFSQSRNVNLQMVAEGQAKLHPAYRGTCASSSNDFANAEQKARNQGLGVWGR